ncbi:MAG TPA: XRE family transcriptional regulator [Gammaproteobacteria bacterium]|nr:XRE family transcriptional regulator [Gammaproteobacteria bacterium]
MSQVISEKLRAERKKAGLSQEKLAWKADLSSSHYRALELGTKQPGMETLFKLSHAFGLHYTELMDEAWKEWLKNRKPSPE